MGKSKIRQEMKEIRERLETLERAGSSRAASDCCSSSNTSAPGATTDEGRDLLDARAGSARLTVRSSIDASRDDNGFLGCMYARYTEHVNNTPSSHWTTAQAFSNIRAISANVGIIVGHGSSGIIVTGTGQTVDGVDKYMASGNQSSWSPHASPGIPGYRLVLFGCKVADGTAGTNFLQRVANVVRKEVGAWTGNVWCSSSNVWADGDFRVATPGKRLEVIESPVMYEINRDMTSLRLRTVAGYEDLSFDRVVSVNFTPIGSIAEQSQAIRAEAGYVAKLLQLIDFANPFVTEDKPGAILVGQLTITYKAKKGQEHSRTFRVLGYSLLQDVCFPTTYYYAANELSRELQAAT